MKNRNAVNKNSSYKDIMVLAGELLKIQNKANELGLFIDDRELLECNQCNLLEDITYEGKLITYFKDKNIEEQIIKDSGFRFKETDNENIFICPKCGMVLKLNE